MAIERAKTHGPNQGPDLIMRPIEGDSRDPIPFYGLSETERKKAKEKLSKLEQRRTFKGCREA